MYSKCGKMEEARMVFDEMLERDIVSWTTMINGYVLNGEARTALNHAGLVDDGLYLFNLMQEDTRRSPNVDHYTCIIDLLGRAGRLEEAYDIITTMPSAPSHAVWGALLGACVIHQKVELGELAAQSLFQLEPENTGNYILLAKLYAAVGRWKDAEALRDVMNDIGLRKEAAYSLTDM
ncbi:unnamed protein product [Linum tenue]|uniref:Pentatricopeptide repeat-containing protein n=1 Tax=Linum tenue TaxID=586396 RepID=A0AAV0K9L9_9ROSI|nr:unnamed protein product [Linum tenue]